MRQNDRYHRLKDLGLCVKCAQPARPGLAMCWPCAIREADLRRQQYLRRKAKTPKQRGRPKNLYRIVSTNPKASGGEVDFTGTAQDIMQRLGCTKSQVYSNCKNGSKLYGIYQITLITQEDIDTPHG